MIKLAAIPLLKSPATIIGVKIAALAAVLVPTSITIGLPLDDPWFIVFVFFYLFSAFTSGMPEPNETSSFGYLWLFRSCHILSANGTAYFASRNKWKEISGE